MGSRRALGVVALSAIVVAAVSFAIVDATIANANGCTEYGIPCARELLPPIAVVFAALGSIALLLSVLPAVTWIVDLVRDDGE